MLEHLGLRLRVFLFFAALATGILAAIGGGLWLGYVRLGRPEALSGFITGGLTAGFVSLGLIVWVWLLFDENVAKAIERLAGGLRARSHADVRGSFDAAIARYLGDLAPAAASVATNLSETRNALAEAVERETTRLAVENARLEALLADVPEGVVLAGADHRIVFYNGPAAALLGDDHGPGLGRPIFDYLGAAPVRAAYARLRAMPEAERGAPNGLLCTALASGAALAGQMRLVSLPGAEGGGAPGYVLTLRDVGSDLALHARREALLADLFDRVRRPAANLLTVLHAGADAEGLGEAALRAEAEAISGVLTELGERYDAQRADWWPMAEYRAADIAEGVAARLQRDGRRIVTETAPLHLRCDGFQIVALLSALAERLLDEHGASALTLLIEAEDDGALISLGWAGPALPIGVLSDWLAQGLDVGVEGVTGDTSLGAHGTEIWPESGLAGRHVLRLPIRQARPARSPGAAPSRGAVYDFGLMARNLDAKLAETRLRDLTFVVFDTETTGLLPSSGDEIVQIAALRVVGGRVIAQERLDALVNPGRSIPASATEVHHITDDMVRDAPPIGIVGRRFHDFAREAVLVAHNAPFDLAFLRRHEPDIGRRFDNPVLDTVLLSAVVFGQSETHTLDALSERLGITIPEADRHTAMGDTIATAAAFEKMIPMLQAQGLETFGQVIAAVRKHGRLLHDLNSAETLDAAALAAENPGRNET
jgi:DNA polymerase-3 subunit epsilon